MDPTYSGSQKTKRKNEKKEKQKNQITYKDGAKWDKWDIKWDKIGQPL